VKRRFALGGGPLPRSGPRPAVALALAGGLIVLVQAAVLAAVAIPAPHSGGDNMAYLALGHALAEGLGYVELWDPRVPPHTKYPPVYPLVLAGLILLGATSWIAFKLSSAVALSGATLLVFAWAARRAGASAAAALALLLVLAAGWQEASRWILSEPWFLLWAYLAFWAAERGLEAEGRGVGRDGAPAESGGTEEAAWLVVAGAAALLAFGVRTAGLPVVLALLLALLAARRLRAAGLFAVVATVAVGGWLLRASRGGEGAYQSEFWLLNPYEPELGRVGLPGLLSRVWTNVQLYAGRVLPGEWWGGAPEWLLWLLGGGLVLFALAGWARRLQRRPGPAELFAPLYGGMILLWPEVWSGDRFLLPLVPLVLLYAGDAAVAGTRRLGEGRWSGGGGARLLPQVAVAAGVLALALPSVAGTLERGAAAAECRARAEAAGDAFACYGRGVLEFRAAAAWMGANLPDDAVALSRKPRILYALDGPRGRAFPFTRDPDRFLEAADEIGARYLLVDHWDAIASLYLVPVVSTRPGAFCWITAWGADPDAPGTTLLGILPPEGRGEEASDLFPCPSEWVADAARDPVVEATRVPLLVSRGGGEAGR
jgi:hypothetical protein